MSNRIPTYNAYIDWYGHGGLSAGLSNWYYEGDVIDLSVSNDQVHVGDHSFKVTSLNTINDTIYRPVTLPQDTETDVTVWVYLPSASTITSVEFWLWSDDLIADSVLYDSVSTSVKDQWVPLTHAFDGLDYTGNPSWDKWIIQMRMNGAVGSYYYLGWSQVVNENDDVSCDLLMTRGVPSITFGRDEAQELASIKPGQFNLSLLNDTSKYTPGNTLSPIAGLVRPNRQILVTATFEGVVHPLFNGYTEDYIVEANLENQSVSIPCIDLLTVLAETEVSTDLYPSIRTGDAVRAILVASGLYEEITDGPYLDPDTALLFDPYIDSGATTLRWWEFTGNALEGIKQVTQAEGPPSLYTIGDSNQIVFKDRHHRVRASYSDDPMMTLVGCEDDITDPTTEFAIDYESTPDHGQTTYFNKVTTAGTMSVPDGDITTVWTDPLARRTFSGSITITADVDGFLDGQSPVQGSLVMSENLGPDETNLITGISPEDADYVVRSGTVSLVDYATSGSRVSITFSASTESATISDLRFRARQISRDDISTEVNDFSSQLHYGKAKAYELDAGDAGPNDAEDIARWVLRQNSSTRPRVEAKIKNTSNYAMSKMLNTELSSLIHTNVSLWFIDEEFTVESIKHELGALGSEHTLTVNAEAKDPSGFESNEFIFGEAGHGFGQGVFGGRKPLNTSTFLYLPGNSGDYASTPDHASLDITTDIDLRAWIKPNTWTPAANMWFISKYETAGDQRSYGFFLSTTGRLSFIRSTLGTSSTNTSTSTANPTPDAYGRLAVRVTLDADNGAGQRVTTFYTAPSMAGPWTVLGSPNTSAGTVTIHAGTAPLTISGNSNGTSNPFNGIVYAAEVRNGIGGTIVANPDFAEVPEGATSFTDSTGKIWTMNGSSHVAKHAPVFTLGTSKLDSLDELWY